MMPTLAARVVLMMGDYHISLTDAVSWVCRRVQANLRAHFMEQVAVLACQAMGYVL